MKKLIYVFFLIAAVLMSSCISKKQLIYLQGVDSLNGGFPEEIEMSYALKIQQGDVLNVRIGLTNSEVLRPFSSVVLIGQTTSMTSNPELVGHRVDSRGYINLPVVGSVKVEGMTCAEVDKLISDRLTESGEAINSIISTTITNFKVSVLGAVARPGSINVTTERFTVLQAIAASGDLLTGGLRKNVLVIREQDGKRVSERIDLTSPDLLNSPVYYLKQNDVIYVEPNASIRIQASPYMTFWNASSGIASLAISLAVLVNAISK